MKPGTLAQSFKYISLLIAAFVVLFPPYIVVVNAFKGNDEFAKSSSLALPNSFFNLDNFRVVFERGKLGEGFANTLIILVVSLLINVALGTMVSYALGRFDFRGKGLITGAYIAATIIPTITTEVSRFTLVKSLGLFNTLAAPMLLYVGADVLQIYIYLQFIRSIPYELDESAMIEGASLFRIFRSIVFPLLTPATATLIILKSISIYNDMFTPYLYMPKSSLGVVTTVLLRFQTTNSAQWNYLCAAILLILIPTVLLYLFMQRYVFSGITSGAVK
jgi:multiple sugar transport system permease protein